MADDHFAPIAQIIISCIMSMWNMILDCKSDCNASWAQKWILIFQPDLSGNCIYFVKGVTAQHICLYGEFSFVFFQNLLHYPASRPIYLVSKQGSLFTEYFAKKSLSTSGQAAHCHLSALIHADHLQPFFKVANVYSQLINSTQFREFSQKRNFVL